VSISANNPWQFSNGVGSERRQSAYAIHKIAASVFGVNPQIFSTSLTQGQRAELERFVGPRGSDGNLSFKAPILFRNCEVTDKNMFFNPILPKVIVNFFLIFLANIKTQILRATLFGSSSLNTQVKRSGPAAKGTKWGINAVTDGSIAWASVIVCVDPSFPFLFFANLSSQACWLCSPTDKEFTIKWRTDFITYKSILHQKRSRAPERMRKLLIWWDVQVFGKSDRASGPEPPSDDIENLSVFVESWHVESDSDDDDLGM
jgi:hypothetical protein